MSICRIIPESDVYSGGITTSPGANRKVLVGGCFDVLHFGHMQFLQRAREVGDKLIVLLESDEFIRRYKKRVSFHTQDQRAYMLSQLRSVDIIILLSGLVDVYRYKELTKVIAPATIATTSGDPHLHHKKACADIVGAQVQIVNDLVEGLSTSTILDYARILHD
jgi:cytidyltransferase-like protein